MQRKHLSLLVAIPAALLFAGVAGAQTPPPAPTPPPPPPTAQAPMQNNGYANQNQNHDQGMSSGMNNAGSQSFSSLAGSKGYVTRSEANNDPWLQEHFAKCDSNHNGKVTRSEYKRCHKQQ